MNKERMNIRASIKEKGILDKKIEKMVSEQPFIEFYSMDNPFIDGLTSPTDAEACMVERFQSLNDLIKRREAINKAILEANANNTVKVRKFVSFEALGKPDAEVEFEEITLANAINRKNYYTGFVLPNIVAGIERSVRQKVVKMNKLVNENSQKVQQVVESRFRGLTNYSQDKVSEVRKEEETKYQVNAINPLKMEILIPKIKEYVEDYIQSIDNALSEKTETIYLDIEY